MIKRFFSLILTICMLSGMVSFAANDYTDTQKNIYENASKLLNVLGIIEGYTDGTYEVNETMTRAEFAEIAVKLALLDDYSDTNTYFYDVKNTNPYRNAINAAYLSGYMTGSGKYFYPERAVKTDEVARVLVMALGYEVTTGNFTLKANQLGLFKDAYFADGKITRGGIVTAVYNALMCDKLIPSAIAENNGEYSYVDMTAAKTLLEDNFDIYEAEGNFTAIADLDLVRIENEDEGYVRIDDVRYKLAEGVQVDTSLLSMYVTYYYRQERKSDIPELVFYTDEDLNEVYYADINTLEASDCTTSEFVYDDGKKERTQKISASAKFIVNGHIIDDSKKNPRLFDINAGWAKLVKPAHGGAEIVWIWDYDYHNVRACGVSEIYLSDGNQIDIYDEKRDDFEVSFFTSVGTPVSKKDVIANSAIAVADSVDANGKLWRTVIILQGISGTVMEFSDDTIVIDETEYPIHPDMKSLKIGFVYNLFVGVNGEICLVDENSEQSMMKGYLIDAKFNAKSIDGYLMLKILTAENVMKIFEVKDKIHVNDRSVKVESGKCDALINPDTGKVIRQPVEYLTDSEGNLKRIYTPTENGLLTLDYEKLRRQCKASSLFSFGAEFTIKADGAIFAVPENPESASDDEFAVWDRSYFLNDGAYTVEAYNVNDLCEADIIVVDAGNTDVVSYNEGNTYTCVFDKKTQTLGADGEVTWQITYWQQGTKYTKALADRSGKATYEATLKEVEKIKRGDLFMIELTVDGLIKNMAIEFTEANRSSATDGFNHGRLMYYGQVQAVGANSIVIRRYSAANDDFLDGTSQILYPNCARVYTYLYSGEDYPIEHITNCIADVRVGDWVVMQSRNLAARSLAVYRDDSKLPSGKLR